MTPPGLEIIDPLEHPGWDEYVANQGGDFFHTSMWAAVLKEAYGYMPLYFTWRANGTLIASVPVMEVKSFITGSRGVSLPFTDYCEPIVSEGISGEAILAPVLDYGKEAGWKYVEIRGGSCLLNSSTPSAIFYGHTLELNKGEEELFSGLKDTTRRNIKKARKEKVEVTVSESKDAVKQFHILNCLTRKRHGLPPQPWRFFESIHKHVISKGHGFVILAAFEKKVVAGAVFFHFNKKALYKFGASDARYQGLRANNLVMWEALRWFSAKGYEVFCFGRTETSNKGLRDFKAGWGAQEKTIKYFKYDLVKKAFVQAPEKTLGYRFFEKTPLPMLKVLGTILYRHVG